MSKLFAFNLAKNLELPEGGTWVNGAEEGSYDEQAQVWKGEQGPVSAYTCTYVSCKYLPCWTVIPWKADYCGPYCFPDPTERDGYGGPC